MINGVMLQNFHWYIKKNVLWKEVIEKAGYFKEIGITAVWLPPAYKCNSGDNSVGYDVYDLFDLGEFDQKGAVATKYGTKEEYLTAIKALQKLKIDVIVDIVLNHKAGGDEIEIFKAAKVDNENRNRFVSEPYEIEGFTKFTFPGRKGKYSTFVWNFLCFTGVDFNKRNEEKAIFTIINEYGDLWEEVVSDEKGNYDYLMYNDVEFRNPAVREELIYWAKWYYDLLQFNGVRLDAVKHISPKFYNEWLKELREHSGKEIFAVGEFWAPGQTEGLVAYINETDGKMSLFDSSLQKNFHDASVAGNSYDMRRIFEGTLVNEFPHLAVTVVDNHDTQPMQALEAPVEFWFKSFAYALILLRESGYPCLFYPDLFGAKYTDKGNDGNEHEINLEIVPNLEKLLHLRKEYNLGRQIDYFDHPNCIAWIRTGKEDLNPMIVVLSNGDKGSKKIELGISMSNKVFYDFLGNSKEEVVIDKTGFGEFICPSGELSVWVLSNHNNTVRKGN